MKYSIYISLLLIAVVGLACKQNSRQNEQDNFNGGAISVEGTRFVDSYGRQVIFSGFNYVNKNPNVNYLEKDSAALFGKMTRMGINCLRLGIIWDGVEPSPGKYNEQYLDEIEKKVTWAAEHNIYIMLDMHQDLYGRKYGDGAPLWATLDDNQPHQGGAIWSDSYLTSASIQRSFDNFWANKPAADGVGIQDHYINMWKHIAERFLKYKNVIGYDFMNEPFSGSDANSIMPLILTEYAKMLAEETGHVPGEKELMEMWAGEESRFKVLQQLSKADKYARILDAAYQANKQFETNKLQPFYQRVTDAIRLVDTVHIVFLEHSYFSNPGIRTAIEPVKAKNGQADPLQAYAGHGYDLVTDTKESNNQSQGRVELIFNRMQETSKRLNVPVLVGEWGALYGEGANTVSTARFILSLFERLQFGNTYWAYGSDLESKPGFNQALLRPYPQFIAGTLNSYSFDRETGAFACTWEENHSVTAPTVIFIPDIRNLTMDKIEVSSGSKNSFIQPIDNSNAGYLVVAVSGEAGIRTLKFSLNADPIK